MKHILVLIFFIQCTYVFAIKNGKGTMDNPFEINTQEEFIEFRDTVNHGYFSACANLNCDIDLSDVCYETEDTIVNWIGIGKTSALESCTITPVYKGYFNGKGHIIKNLYVNSDIECYEGVFGVTDSATILNLGIENAKIKAGYYVGGIVGISKNTNITNCYVKGQIHGYFVSGIIGNATNCIINNCYTSCEVTGNYNGNICNYNSETTITNCFYNLEIGRNASNDHSIGLDEESMKRELSQKLNTYIQENGSKDLVLWTSSEIDSFPSFKQITDINDVKREYNELCVYTQDGHIIIHCEKKEFIQIYNTKGVLISKGFYSKGNHTINFLRKNEIYFINNKKIAIK